MDVVNVASSRPEIGIPLGILIGVVSGVIADVLIGTIRQGLDVQKALQVTGEFVAIPAFWFGGSWLSTRMLESIEPADIISSYMLALTVSFMLTVIWPLLNWVIQLGNWQAAPKSPSPGSPSSG